MDTLNWFKSGLRKDLLLLFFTNPERKYYVRQLAKQLNASPGTIHREIKNLEKSGIISSEKVGNIIQYTANTHSSLFKEIESIIFKTIGIAGNLKSIIEPEKEVSIAFIYGSYANKSENQNSDIDIMIIGKTDMQKLAKEIYEYEKKIERDINFNVYSIEEWKKYKQSQDSFVTGIIRDPKIWLKGDEDGL